MIVACAFGGGLVFCANGGGVGDFGTLFFDEVGDAEVAVPEVIEGTC
jgi:hypothetical protein